MSTARPSTFRFARLSRLACLGLAAGTLALATPAAHAQFGGGVADSAKNQQKLEPPQITSKRGEPVSEAWGYVATIFLLLIVVGANLIPSKRGHQD
ncbi:MAG: hypothetical protein LW650_04725 [Planctomycetaceae bacterium]|jgi:hypothetical protein|nr:hypothetical protein [Phycisphaerales bacterium]MCE2652811.1 hypothetical protein [Planctomycetaceae bacterium]